jgi:DNA polymerase-3 subunit epsilon
VIVINLLDIESTGLEQSKGHRIIEVCMRMHDWPSRRLRGVWTQRINPMRSIEPKAQAVHGISLADLEGKPTWDVVGPQVARLLGATTLGVAHNASFDFPFIVEELLRIGAPLPAHMQVFDTMLEGRWATPLGKIPSLQELCFACDVPYDPALAHAAEYDVDRMTECFWRGIDWGFFNVPLLSAPTMEAIAA